MGHKCFFKINNAFGRFMVSYIIVLCFTVIIGMVTYSETLKMVRKDSINEGLILLDKGKDILDNRFVEVDNLITQISFEEDVANLYNISYPLKYNEYCRLREAFSRISSFMLTNDFIDELCIVIRNSDVFISSRNVSDRLPSFYNSFFSYEGIEYREWYDKIMSTYHYRSIWPAHLIVNNGNKCSMVTYLQSIPLSRYNSYRGVALALIDERKIRDYLNTLDIWREGWLYIINAQGQVVTSVNTKDIDITSMDIGFSKPKGFMEKKIDGINYVIIYTSSSQLGWTYVAALPPSVFNQKAAYVRTLFSFTFAAILFAGFFIAFYLSYRNSKPIMNIINHLKEAVEGEQVQNNAGYDFIEGTVSKLITNNKELKQEIDNRVPFLRAAFFERLLKGDFNQIREIDIALSYSRLDITSSEYAVALMRINGFDLEPQEENISEAEAARIIAENVLKRNLWKTCYFHNVDQNKIAVIMGLDWDREENRKDAIEKRFKEVIEQLNTAYNIRVSFGIGKAYSSLMDVASSYKDAQRALGYLHNEQSKNIIWFKDIPQKGIGYYYPIDLEMRLINLVRSGEESEVMSIIKLVYVKNFIHRQLSMREINLLLYEIRGTIEKVKEEMVVEFGNDLDEVDGLISNMDYCSSAEETFELIIKIYKCFCLSVNNKKKLQDECLIQEIIKFINAHYMDEAMSLNYVASEFGLTEKYLSQFFKEKTDENFSCYIEKLRMQQAVMLLDQKSLSVNDIAKRVGYINNNTFYKAFKRMYGISPSVYRRNHL